MLLTLRSSRIWIQGNTENIDGLAFSPVYTGDLEGCLMWKQFLAKSGEAFAITATSMAKVQKVPDIHLSTMGNSSDRYFVVKFPYVGRSVFQTKTITVLWIRLPLSLLNKRLHETALHCLHVAHIQVGQAGEWWFVTVKNVLPFFFPRRKKKKKRNGIFPKRKLCHKIWSGLGEGSCSSILLYTRGNSLLPPPPPASNVWLSHTL